MFLGVSLIGASANEGLSLIAEMPNEYSVFSTMQSSIGEKTGLYIFRVSASAKIATRRNERGDATVQQRIAARPPAYGLDKNERFVLELVRLPGCLCRQLHPDRDSWFRFRWSYCRVDFPRRSRPV